MTPRRKRLTRAESQEQTRRRLVDAALRVCVRRGLHQATAEEIAEDAGFSRGAIYSSFGGKDGLLLALFDERLEPRLRALAAPLIEAGSAPEQAAALRALLNTLLTDERRYLLLLCEFWGYAARGRSVRTRFARVRRDRRAAIEAMIDERLARRPAGMRVPPSYLAAGFTALAIGLLFEGLIDSELDAEEIYGSLFTLLARAAVEPGGT